MTPKNMIDAQRLAGFWSERGDILERIKTYHAAGDSFQRDLALDDLVDWERRRQDILAEGNGIG